MSLELIPVRRLRFTVDGDVDVDVDAAASEHSLVNEIMALGRLGPALARHRRQTRRLRVGDYLAKPGRRAVDRTAS